MKWFNFDNVVGFCITCLALGLFGFGAFATISSVRSNGEADYCYVEMWSPGQMAPQFQLYAHRPWRSDRMLGVWPTVDEARTKAELVNCPMGARR